MFTAKGILEAEPFMHYFQKYLSYGVHFFECSKFNVDEKMQ